MNKSGVIIVIVIVVLSVSGIYLMNVPRHSDALASPYFTFMQNNSQTESFRSNSVLTNLAPQPPIYPGASTGLYFNSPENLSYYNSMVNLEASSLVPNGINIQLINISTGNTMGNYLATEVTTDILAGFENFSSVFSTGTLNISSYVPELLLNTTICPLGQNFSTSHFAYLSTFGLRVTGGTHPIISDITVTSSTGLGTLTIKFPLRNLENELLIYYHNNSLNLNEYAGITLKNVDVKITNFVKSSFGMESEGSNFIMPVTMVKNILISSSFPAVTTALLTSNSINSSKTGLTKNFINKSINVESYGSILVGPLRETIAYPYKLAYTVYATESLALINKVSIYNTTSYEFQTPIRLLSGIVGGALIGLSPQIATQFVEYAKKRGRR